jgi:glucose/arabinose dehydrogenase
MAWEPDSGALWTAVNERDELGPDLVPDFMTAVKDGGFYGWPYSYYGATSIRASSRSGPDLVAKAIKPDYALGSHTASLGLASARGAKLAAGFENGMFVGQHGSWNRKPPSGYKVIFVPFANGRPSGPSRDVLTGFLSSDGDAWGARSAS